jgi:hypothetical protein
MGYRVFRDSRGTEWQTWDVVPRLGERRSGERRRPVTTPPPASDRRHRTERRVVIGRRPVLGDGLYAGWLCFEAPIQKRRLTPIPADWQQCEVDRLEQYCRQATPAERISIRP